MKNNEGFRPNDNQLRYLQAFISSEHTITKRDLCKQLEFSPTTIWNWEQNDDYNEWFHNEVVKAMGRGLTKVYQGMGSRASKNVHDATLYLKRFDDDYREKQEIKHKIEFDEGYSEELKKVTDKELEDME